MGIFHSGILLMPVRIIYSENISRLRTGVVGLRTGGGTSTAAGARGDPLRFQINFINKKWKAALMGGFACSFLRPLTDKGMDRDLYEIRLNNIPRGVPDRFVLIGPVVFQDSSRGTPPNPLPYPLFPGVPEPLFSRVNPGPIRAPLAPDQLPALLRKLN